MACFTEMILQKRTRINKLTQNNLTTKPCSFNLRNTRFFLVRFLETLSKFFGTKYDYKK